MEDKMDSKSIEPVAYGRRFWMLFLLILSILVNVAQMNQYTALDKTMVKYYGVSDTTVSLTSVSYLLAYLLFFFPATIYTEKCGLRHSFVLGSFLNAVGLCLKCFALKPGTFWLVIVAQVFPAIGETLITPSIPALAATWFKTNEVASVVALSFASSHCGLGFTFLFQGTLFAKGADIEYGLSVLGMSLAGFSVAVFLVTCLTMEDRPLTPPSVAQAKKLEQDSGEFKLTTLLKDSNFIYISLAAGIIGANEFAVAFSVNQLILTAFPGGYTDVSINGASLSIAYVIGSLLFSTALDRTKRFKHLSRVTYLFTILSTFMFGLGLNLQSRLTTFLSVCLFGLFTGAAGSVAMDSNIELTYPFPETISISLIYCMSCVVPMILTPLGASLVDIIGSGNVVFIYAFTLIPGFWCLFRIKWTLKRLHAEECQPLLKSPPKC